MSNAEQALSAGIGAAIGFFIGGPAGAFAGFQYGLLAGSILFPTQLPGVQGPRLEDFERAEADPGSPIWKVYGRVAVPGFRLYLGEPVTIETTEEVGGKGAPTQDVTTFTYTQTLALGLCEGPIAGITRVWENGKLVYDVRAQQNDETDDAYQERLEASAAYADTFVLYLGDEEQLPDPTLELEKGVGNVPAYRGLAYMVYPDRLLQPEQATRHPVFKVEVAKAGDVGGAALVAISRDGGDQRAARSTDGGETWTLIDTPVATGGGGGQLDWTSVAFAPPLKRLVAVCTRLVATEESVDTMYSDDLGQTWIKLFSGVTNGTNQWWRIKWIRDGGGFFLASAYASSGAVTENHFRKSADGLTWVGKSIPGSLNRPIHSFAYAPPLERIVAYHQRGIGGADGGVSYSDDFGETWTEVDNAAEALAGFGFPAGDITWDEEREVFFLIGKDKFATSPDGEEWSAFQDTSTVANTNRAVYVPPFGAVLVTAIDGDVALWAGGLTMTPAERPIEGHIWYGASYDASRQRAMMVGHGTGGDKFAYKALANGDWTFHDMPAQQTWSDVVACVIGGTGDAVALSTIVTSICADATITDIDVTELEEIVIDGYAVTRVMNARSALDPIRMVGLFDYVESDGILKFPVRGKAPVATIDEDDLGATIERPEAPLRISTRKLQDVELPRQIRLKYLSYARDYEKGEQLSPARIGTTGVNVVDVDCPVVLDDDRAAQLAEIFFRDAWAGRWQHSFTLDRRFHHLEPGDVLLVPIDERLYRLRILTIRDRELMLRELEALRDDDGSYTSTAVATPPERPPPTLQSLGATEAYLLDLPALQDTHDDAGFYLAARNAGPGTLWTGAHIWRSIDDGATYQQIATVAAQAVVGTIVSHPASGDTYTWDDSSEIVVDILSGSLESRTDAAVLAGANAAAIGAHGRWHIVQFANAELVSTGRYRLTRLLLGRRGTEHLIGEVQVGDTFVLVSGPGIYRMPLQTSEIGAARLYRAVTAGANFNSASDVSFTGAGQALETFSPVHVSGERDESDNLTISWVRRDRLSQTLRDGVAVPNSEDSESYEVDIMDGSSVVRTLESSDTDVEYSAADQTTDFGSPQSSITVRVYQLSATVGRGTPAEATL